jgi:hypothetical protein
MTMAFGSRVYGLGVMALAMVCLVWGDFDPGQPVPKGFPDRTALAYAAAAFLLVAGAAVEWRRTAAWGAAALTAYYAFTPLVHMPMLLAKPSSHGNWAENALNLVLVGVAWVVADPLARPRR